MIYQIGSLVLVAVVTAVAMEPPMPEAFQPVDLANATYDCSTYHEPADALDDCPGEFWAEPFTLKDGHLTTGETVKSNAVLLFRKNSPSGAQMAIVATDGGGMGACVFAYLFRAGVCADAYQLGERSRIDSFDVSSDRAVVVYRRRAIGDPSSAPSSTARLEVPLWK